jgi:hypothetical protein
MASDMLEDLFARRGQAVIDNPKKVDCNDFLVEPGRKIYDGWTFYSL